MKKIHYIMLMLAAVLTGCWSDYNVEQNPLVVSHAEVYRIGSKIFTGVTFKNQVGQVRFTNMELFYEQNGVTYLGGAFSQYNPEYIASREDTVACVFHLPDVDESKSLRLSQLYAINDKSRSRNLFSLLDESQLTFRPSDYREAPLSVSLEVTPGYGECAWKVLIDSPIRNLIQTHVYLYRVSSTGTTYLNSTTGSGYYAQTGQISNLKSGQYDFYAEVMLYICGEEVLTLVTPHQTVTIK